MHTGMLSLTKPRAQFLGSCRSRRGNGPEIFSVFRRLALSILKADTTVKDNVRGKRLSAGWNLDKLKGILLAFQAV